MSLVNEIILLIVVAELEESEDILFSINSYDVYLLRFIVLICMSFGVIYQLKRSYNS